MFVFTLPEQLLFNEWYAKDTSKKIRAVKRSKGMAGEHIGSHPPYGYMKNPENKKEWIIDEEAAEVVREIFRLCVGGLRSYANCQYPDGTQNSLPDVLRIGKG